MTNQVEFESPQSTMKKDFHQCGLQFMSGIFSALLDDMHEILGFVMNFHIVPSEEAALATTIIFQIFSV